MKKIFGVTWKILLSLSIICIGFLLGYYVTFFFNENTTENIVSKITNSVVFVDESSGVVIYSDQEKSLILTAYHVVSDDFKEFDLESKLETTITFLNYLNVNDLLIIPVEKTYEVVDVDVDVFNDLAILEVKIGNLDYVNVSKNNPKVGDSVWLCSNPDTFYRSLSYTKISSTERFYDLKLLIEINGGVVFGSSGGGVFNENSDLVGIIRAVDMLEMPNGDRIPMTFLGMATPVKLIKSFLLNGKYSEYFKYLE